MSETTSENCIAFFFFFLNQYKQLQTILLVYQLTLNLETKQIVFFVHAPKHKSVMPHDLR